jgi:lipopolysaccharide/colanic/teichoic acid biosynthesis glycosyltransferase
MRTNRIKLAIVLVDVLSVPLSLFIAYLLRYGKHIGTDIYLPSPWAMPILTVSALGAWFLLYEPMSLDCFRECWQLPGTISRLVLAEIIQMAGILALAYLLRLYYSRLVLVYFAALFCCLVLATRLVVFVALRHRRRAGKTRRAVILGQGRVASELARRIQRHPELLFEVIGALSISSNASNVREEDAADLQGIGSIDVLRFLREQRVQDLFVCQDHGASLELQNFILRCREQGIGVSLLPHTYELYSSKAKLLEIDGVPFVSLEEPRHFRTAAMFKRAVDLVLGVVLLGLAVPIIGLAGAGLWWRERRFLRCEVRCGLDGRTFRMYRLDIDRNSPNAPAFHQILAWLSISELPQLGNVILGHMSLVGPRPEAPERVRNYSEWQRQRLKVKPGITGLAQVNGLREQHSSEEKTRYDLQYMVEWTPIMDLVLLLETVWTLVARLGTRPKHDELPPVSDQQRHKDSRSVLAGSSVE